MHLVAWIDSLRRVANLEVLAHLQPGKLLQNRYAVVLSTTWINRALVNDTVPFL